MTIDEEDAGEAVNGTLNGTNYYARYDDRMNNKWSPGMWAYDTHAWTQRSHDVMNDDAKACPGEGESDEELEEVTRPELCAGGNNEFTFSNSYIVL